MAKTYFQFKKFTIEQEACANKVSTDACVFGAFLAKHLPECSVLDIGAGSALLCLMMAQGKIKTITGIEIEKKCFVQAKKNVGNSLFRRKINLHCTDAKTWKNKHTFDYIISNPPFFNNTFKNKDTIKNLARQTESLSPNDWISILKNNASKNTVVILLLSKNDVLLKYEKALAHSNFIYQSKTLLLDKKNSSCKRIILYASQQKVKTNFPSTFIYKKQDGSYTKTFIDLLSDFYLYL